MNSPAQPGLSRADLPPLQRLLLAYAPVRAREWQGLCWLLDQRLAAIARRGGEPTIGAIRMAWWDAVLVENDLNKGSGEPLVERWRIIAPAGATVAAERLIGGWRLLISPEPLSDEDLREHGLARGGGLFALLASGARGAALDQAGAIWALWDLAAHVRDETLARRAIGMAREMAKEGSGDLAGADLKPLRLARAIALPDVRAGRLPGAGFTLRHYGRLLLNSLRS